MATDIPSQEGVPETFRIEPDEWHIEHVGRLSDGNLFFLDTQLDYQGNDYIVLFLFNMAGDLVSHQINLIGKRGEYSGQDLKAKYDKMLSGLEGREITAIQIKPFSVQAHGREFGMIPRPVEEDNTDPTSGEWVIEFMPGNTLMFYWPWDGSYDT